MGVPLDLAKRQSIIGLYQSGKSLRTISNETGTSYGSVQKLCARYKSEGESGLLPRYSNCGKRRPGPDDFVYRAVRCFRHWHPSWGAGKIRTELLRLRPELRIPHVRTLQYWFQWNSQAEHRSRTVREQHGRAQACHDTWKVDAKEHVQLGDKAAYNWLTIIDEYSGGLIDAGLFSRKEDFSS